VSDGVAAPMHDGSRLRRRALSLGEFVHRSNGTMMAVGPRHAPSAIQRAKGAKAAAPPLRIG
jgi:hypothetical protein